MTEPFKRDRTGEPIDMPSMIHPRATDAIKCQSCLLPDPHARTAHHLSLLKLGSQQVLRDHLHEQFVTLRDHGKKREDVVDSIMAWASNMIQQYSGMAHPVDGHPMPWWEARALMIAQRQATAESAYNHAPEKWKQRAEAREVPGFTRPSLAQRLGAAEFARKAVVHMPTDTPDAARAKEIKQTHLEHKQILGSRYRPPCIHGHRGDENDKHWPDNPCDPDLCDAHLVPAHVRQDAGDDDPLGI